MGQKCPTHGITPIRWGACEGPLPDTGESLSLFKSIKVDQGAVVGNNDHSLAVLGPDTTLKHRQRLLLNI